MVNLLQLFCCSEENEDSQHSKLNTNSNTYRSSNKTALKNSKNSTDAKTNRLIASQSPTSLALQKSLAPHPTNMNNSTSKNKIQPSSTRISTVSPTAHTNPANVHIASGDNNSCKLDPSKTDVKVYEATDSTADSNDDDEPHIMTTSHPNSNRTVVQQQDISVGSVSSDEETAQYVPTAPTTAQDKQPQPQPQPGQQQQDQQPQQTQQTQQEAQHDQESQLDLTKIQPGQAHKANGWLLDPQPPRFKNKKCLILDLDETLVHSSFKYLRQADFVIPVDIENAIHNVYVIKRPGVDEFLKRVGELYEVVVFTASVSRYGDPLLDELDIHKAVHHRLFRDSCYNYQGNFIKNLSQIGRPLNEIIILDNSPASYIFHPQHAIPISSWFSDAHDNELLDIIPFLEDLSKDNVEDVGVVLDINL